MYSITSQFGLWRGAGIFGLTLLTLSGCAHKVAHVPASPALSSGPPDHIDLEPGWRLRVVTPILKSGGYLVKSSGEPVGTTLQAGSDFLGYEVAYYAVRARGIEFTAGEVHKKDTVVTAAQPMVPLFRLPKGIRHIRLIYLVRVSDADHDMAVVAARHKGALDPLTAQFRAKPASCRDTDIIYCAWIPDGIAVAPEMRASATGAEQWVPAH
jgi:hypothetical protein